MNLKDLHKNLANLLEEFHEFAKVNEIKYFLSYGNLLGYKRHNKEFIPWDDDLDIGISREHYDKLRELDYSNVSFKWTDLTTGDNHNMVFGKIVSKELNVETTCEMEIVKGSKLFIDIFPMDNCHKSKIKESFKLLGLWKTLMSIDTRWFYLNIKKMPKFKRKITVFGRLFLILFGALPRSYDKLSMKAEKKAKKGNSKVYKSYFMWNEMRSKFKHEDIYPVVEDNFCGVKTYIPNNPGAILKELYGEWEKAPKEKNRKPKHGISKIKKEKENEV